jgi:beta-phosphoglucomutase
MGPFVPGGFFSGKAQISLMKAVIFDWDGTLADTFSIGVRAWKKTLGDDFAEKDLKDSFGPGAKQVVREFLRKKQISFDEETVARIVGEKIKAHLEIVDETKLFAGALELLDYLRHGKYEMGLCSSNNHAVIDPLIKKYGLSKYFGAVVTADHMRGGLLKPHPGIFLFTAKEMKVAPEECVVFEDSPIGIEAAKKAGMKVVGVCTGPFTEKEIAEKGPDRVIGSLKELDEIKRFLGEKE